MEAMRPQEAPPVTPPGQDERQQRNIILGLSIGGFALLALLVGGVILLALPSTDTAKVRDIFIIFMSLESLLLGLALIILIAQIARLTNLLQNEVKPILEATNETINTLRGTTEFLSENLVEPVIKLNEYAAALSQLFGLFSLGRRRNPNKTSKSN
jgi:hypothetical protein